MLGFDFFANAFVNIHALRTALSRGFINNTLKKIEQCFIQVYMRITVLKKYF